MPCIVDYKGYSMGKTTRPSFEFTDYSVLITGGTSGMGAAAASAFALSGARVMIAGRSEERAQALIDQSQSSPGEIHFSGGDITDPDHCQRLVDVTPAQIGTPDVIDSGVVDNTRAVDDDIRRADLGGRHIHQSLAVVWIGNIAAAKVNLARATLRLIDKCLRALLAAARDHH
ncbi:MAG: SDR family NAD(P)-dependent oxidoreductase, partial [Pseudomonadota bacterium]